ncbi:hypothetical protein KVT40_006654 [Elsinoe batatas]|uniref:LysM domain-containing protein n=1 Tax=Elsinoe batatas TaxID=2601811 RepID=A0A8K0KYG1_9PEZI|nr:hypothetical protein KVT40_006654 [Elsinoe batatas]
MRSSQISTAVAALAVGQSQACTFTAAAWSGLTCATFASQWSLSTETFISWNPSVGANCANGLVPGNKYCVEGGTASTPAPPGAPSSTQPGINSNCANFYPVASGDFCQKIADQFRITVANFLSWNTAINSACSNLQPGYFVCVGLNSQGGFKDSYPGLEGITSLSGFDLVPSNTANPLRVAGRVLGAGLYPDNTWVDWLNTVECESPSSPRRFDQTCATRAFVAAVSSAVQYVANTPELTYGTNAAAIRVIGPYYNRLNQFNAYTSDNGQGKSCTDCPAPANPQAVTSWKGTFLPDGTQYFLKTRRIKVTCKKACGAKDINVGNLEAVLPLISDKIREQRGAGANFFLWRATTLEVVARCRVTYAQGTWFDRVDGGADLVYGGEEAGSCFKQP